MYSEKVLSIFKEITRIPRESGHEEPMTAFLQRFAEVVVLNERIAEISFLCEPAGIPVFDDAHA